MSGGDYTPPMTTLTEPQSDDSLMAAARAFLPEATAFRAVAGRAHLLRAEGPDRQVVVRRIPAAITPERLAATHGLLLALHGHGERGVPMPIALPDGSRVLLVDGMRYDARTFLPGRVIAKSAVNHPGPEAWVDLPVTLPDPAFADAVTALARLHAATEGARGLPTMPAAPLVALPGAVQTAYGEARRVLRPVAPATPSVQRWLAASERALPAAEAALAAMSDEVLAPSVVAHLGVWPGHFVLDDAERVTGVLGWDHAAYSSPLLDLAQAANRLRGWSSATAEEIIAIYTETRGLSPAVRRALPAVATFDLIGTSGALLMAAYAPHPDAPAPPSALKQEASRLVDMLESASVAIAAMDAKSKPAAPSGAARRKRAQGPKSWRR